MKNNNQNKIPRQCEFCKNFAVDEISDTFCINKDSENYSKHVERTQEACDYFDIGWER